MEDPGVPKKRGSLILGTCDREGYTELFTKEGRSVILPTTCKTWRCVICRRKLLALFRARVEIGASRLGVCGFITITYQADSKRLQDVRCAQKDWSALWLRLKRAGHRWEWLKVTEKTKKGIPHHHVIVGPIGMDIRCHGKTIRKGRETKRYTDRLATCPCLAHTFAREWLAITGDSYIVFATPVTEPGTAGGYLAKYMEKTFDGDWVTRRFSTSRGWPGGGRIRLAQTVDKGWDHIVRWGPGRFDGVRNLNAREEDLLERVGEDLTKEKALKSSKRRAQREYEGIIRRYRATQLTG